MRNFIYFLLILFIEITCGIILYVLYYMFSTLVFNNGGENLVYIILMLLPPSFYCWMEGKRYKKAGDKRFASLYMAAALAYLVGGSVFLFYIS